MMEELQPEQIKMELETSMLQILNLLENEICFLNL